jgi:hypothetical protein
LAEKLEVALDVSRQSPEINQLELDKGGRRSAVSSLFVLTVYTLLTLILTHPLLFNLTTAVPSDIGDPLLNTWILAWDAHALLTDPLNLFNANIFYPLLNTLAYSEHLFSTALLALPLQLITVEPVTAYNLSLLASFPLAAFGMYLLAYRWTRCRSAAFIAGLIFAFAPYRFAAIAHLQLLTFQWLPYALVCLDSILFSGPPNSNLSQPKTSRRTDLALVIFFVLQILASWYLAVYTLVIVGFYLLAAGFSQRLTSRNLIKLFFYLLFSILLILPLVWPYLSLLPQLREARPLSLALSLAAAPTDYLASAPFNRLFGPLTESFRQRAGFTEENTLWVGLVGPILTLIALFGFMILDLRPVPRPGIFTIFAHQNKIQSVKSFNPLAPRAIFFALVAIFLLALALTLSAPYATVAQLVPFSTIIRVPPRWIIPALFALAGLAAFGYQIVHRITNDKLRFRLLKPILLAAISLIILAESFSVPLPLAEVNNRTALSPAYHWLAGQPSEKALVELPLHSAPAPEYPEVKRLYASTLGWWKLINGYSGYTPSRQPQLAQALADFPDPGTITTLQALAASPLPLFLLIHPGEAPFDRTHWETTARWQAEADPALRPMGQFDSDYLYQVLPPNPTRFTTPPIATFGTDQSIQLMAYELVNLQPSNPPTSSPQPASLILYWQTTAPLPANYTAFIHLRAPDGFVRAQADGPPVSSHYPTTAWPPGQIIQDIHPLPPEEWAQIDHLAVGLYHPATTQRLPAFDANGRRLTEDALILPLNKKQ